MGNNLGVDVPRWCQPNYDNLVKNRRGEAIPFDPSELLKDYPQNQFRTNDGNGVSIGKNLGRASSLYSKQICYYNYTPIDLYVVDREDNVVYLEKNTNNRTEHGLKIVVVREYDVTTAKHYLNHLNLVNRSRDFTVKEMEDYRVIVEGLNSGLRTIKVEKEYRIDIGQLNNNGFLYERKLDLCIYRSECYFEKKYHHEELDALEIESKKKESKDNKLAQYDGLLDIFIIDNTFSHSKAFTKILNRVVSIPVLRDNLCASGIYVKIENGLDLSLELDHDEVCHIKNSEYKFYNLERLGELCIFNNVTEARNSELYSQKKALELEELRHKNRVELETYRMEVDRLKHELVNKEAEIKKAALESSLMYKRKEAEMKLLYQSKMDALSEEHDRTKIELDNLKTRFNITHLEKKNEIELTSMKNKSKHELFKMRLEQIKEAQAVKLAKIKSDQLALKQEMEDRKFLRVHQMTMDVLEKEHQIKETKLQNDMLNLQHQQRSNGLKDVTEACRTGMTILEFVKSIGALAAI